MPGAVWGWGGEKKETRTLKGEEKIRLSTPFHQNPLRDLDFGFPEWISLGISWGPLPLKN